MRVFCILVASLVSAVLAHPSDAALTYVIEFQTSGLILNPGETATGSLLLRELDDGSGNNPAISLENGNGVFGFAFDVTRLSGDAILSNLNITPGFSFQANPQPNPNVTAGLITANVASSNPFGNSPGVGDTSGVFTLATFDVTGGVSSSQFQIGSLGFANPVSLGAILSSQRSLNVSEITYQSFTVTAVPEPGSLAVLGAVSCGVFVRFRKRFFRKEAISA